jgi:4-amino-4-deoxy-L-arabinose transferase-like glycosyltransferase
MPHAYNFFLIAAFLFLSDRWYTSKDYVTTLLLGIVFGLIVLIRPVNGIVLFFFLLYNLEGIGMLKERIKLFTHHYLQAILFAALTFLVVLPQLLYWQKTTGSLVFNSYPGEQFYFSNPHIIDGLFSYRKGWLLYTPIMLFGLVGIGLNTKNRLSSLMVIIPAIYLMFSWWNWWYGGSFGCRPIIDFYPILAIGIAMVFQKASEVKWGAFSMLPISLLLIAFNLFQTLQKKSDAIHWEGMTQEAYWHNFLHRYPQPGFEEKLKMPDTEAAKAGIDEY